MSKAGLGGVQAGLGGLEAMSKTVMDNIGRLLTFEFDIVKSYFCFAQNLHQLI